MSVIHSSQKADLKPLGTFAKTPDAFALGESLPFAEARFLNANDLLFKLKKD